jgi:hypothetical protein
MKTWKIITSLKRPKGMKRFKEARDRGCRYLLQRCRLDDGLGFSRLGVFEYGKVLTALQVSGCSNAAGRLCDWIRANGMKPEGDLAPRPEKVSDHNYTYPNSWVIMGAHRLGQFDLSQKAMDFLMDFWDSKSGGFYSSATERNSDTKQDVIYVSFCGLAALYTGRLDVARAVGRWMRTIIELQPNFPKELYTVYSRDKGLHELPKSENDLRYVVSQNATRGQLFFQPGTAAVYLARLYQATGEKEWIDLARQYMQFPEGANDSLFRLLQAGKVGWAASVLYTLTGEEKYKEMAIRIGDNLIAAQSRKGYWKASGSKKPNINFTAEMVIWLDEIHQAAGRE